MFFRLSDLSNRQSSRILAGAFCRFVPLRRTAILVITQEIGEAFTDRARVVSRFASLSVEPDVVVAFWESLQSGWVRYVPAASGEPDRYKEMEGAPDVVVEVVSDSSKAKDTKRLSPLYARAGIPEIWIADTRGPEVRFQIHVLSDNRYLPAQADAEGWMRSPRFGLSFRLTRRSTPVSTWHYVLEHQPVTTLE